MSLPEHLREALREAGRLATRMRRQVTKQCPVCGREFTGLATRVYCSQACQSKAYRRRNREAYLERQRRRRRRQGPEDKLKDPPPSEGEP